MWIKVVEDSRLNGLTLLGGLKSYEASMNFSKLLEQLRAWEQWEQYPSEYAEISITNHSIKKTGITKKKKTGITTKKKKKPTTRMATH